MKRCVVLEPAAEEVCNQNSIPPLIFQIPPEEGRQRLEDAQNTPVYKYPEISVSVKSTPVNGEPFLFILFHLKQQNPSKM